MTKSKRLINNIYAHCERKPERIFRYARILQSIRFLYNISKDAALILLLLTATSAFGQDPNHKMSQNDCDQFIATTMVVAVKFNVTVKDILMHAGGKTEAATISYCQMASKNPAQVEFFTYLWEDKDLMLHLVYNGEDEK